jgi:DNA invertase Pin-like site-specific DNA recombinase
MSMNNNKFFLYTRKSTDVEDKQVLSIEAQITELRAFAKTEGLNVIEEFIEKQSAKIPGLLFSTICSRGLNEAKPMEFWPGTLTD